MKLTTKFKKDIGTLRAAANKEIFLDVKYPKLYKKVKRYYEGLQYIDLKGEGLVDEETLDDEIIRVHITENNDGC